MIYKYTPYSVSKIECFEQCPLKFKLIYIDKVKVKSKQFHLQKGRTWHKLIELKLLNKIKEYKHGNYSEYTLQELNKDLAKIKKLFSSEQFNYFKNFVNILTEQYFNIDKNFNCSFSKINNNDDVLLRGYIDFLGYNINEKLEIVDWKTGGKSFENILKFPKSTFQLEVYQYAVSKIFNNFKKINSNYFYVEHDLVIENENINLDNIKNIIIEKINKIENATFFNKIETPLCGWCDFIHICEGIDDVRIL